MRPIIIAALAWLLLLALCGGTYLLLSTGYAPSPVFLFVVRDVIWMLLYIAMLVMAGVTVALVVLSLFGATPLRKPTTTKPKTDAKAKDKARAKAKGKTDAKAA